MIADKLTIEEALQRASFYFRETGIEQPRDEAEILLGYLLGWGRLKLFLERSTVLADDVSEAYTSVVKRRAGGEPAAYITGNREFYGLNFIVDRTVLIPRPETEFIVDAALEWARGRSGQICGVDLGCGSGNLAVALACHLPESFFYAADLSPRALQRAETNASRHGVSDRIWFYRGDYFKAFSAMKPPPRFNLVVSNPPYLTTAEIAALPATIRNFEPHLALDGGEDGLSAYRSILAALPCFTEAPGLVALEIDAARSGAVLSLCRDLHLFHTLTMCRDYQGFPRVLLGLF